MSKVDSVDSPGIDILSSEESDDDFESITGTKPETTLSDSDTDTKQDDTLSVAETELDDISEEETDLEEDNIMGILDTKHKKIFTNSTDNYKLNKSKKKLSLPYLTKFERSLIQGILKKQLISNGKPMVDIKNCSNVRDILKKEFIEKKIPLLIRRHLPNNCYEDWKLNELQYSINDLRF